MRRGIESTETLAGRERVYPHGWTTTKEVVVLFVTTKGRSCPLMPQFTCRAAGLSWTWTWWPEETEPPQP